ncbi:MAG: tetratricopeptide repeat protein [Vicinamibacterales bacterium]
MLLSLLLLTMLAQDPASASPTTDRAIQLATNGQDAEALTMFQRLAAADPANHEVRLWIARLHERLGRPALAEGVYHSVLLEDGMSMEAMLGVGRSLLAQNRAEDAIASLERAERASPNNADVLKVLGDAHAVAGHEAQAVTYLRRAAVASPSLPNKMALERARRTYGHSVNLGYSTEQYEDTTPDSRLSDINVNLRLSSKLRAFGRGQVQRKFSQTEHRAGGGIEWRWNPTMTLTGHAIVGPGNDVMPRGDYLGEVDYTYRGFGLSGGVRYFDFDGISTVVVSPTVTWWPTERLSLGLRYALSFSNVSGGPSGTEQGQALHLRSSYQLIPRLWTDLAYAYGVEDFENFSVERIGDFRANTGSAGLRIELPTLTSLKAMYEYQRRQDGPTLARVTVLLGQRF